jgi:hypothetical protein
MPRRRYTREFLSAVKLVNEQGCSIPEAAKVWASIRPMCAPGWRSSPAKRVWRPAVKGRSRRWVYHPQYLTSQRT